MENERVRVLERVLKEFAIAVFFEATPLLVEKEEGFVCVGHGLLCH